MSAHDDPRLEVERAVLGALIQWPDRAAGVRPLLRPQLFADPDHRLLYEAVIERISAAQPIDPGRLATELHPRISRPWSLVTRLCHAASHAAFLAADVADLNTFARRDEARAAVAGRRRTWSA